MAEPASPPPPENGNGEQTPNGNGNGAQQNRLDRGATRGGRVQANTWAAGALMGLGLLVGLWFLVGGEEEERGPHTRRAAVNPDEAPTVSAQLPDPEPDPPLLTRGEEKETPTTPDIDPFAEERMRMLLARVRRLQQEQEQRRRSKVLAFSSTAGLKAAAGTAGLPPADPRAGAGGRHQYPAGGCGAGGRHARRGGAGAADHRLHHHGGHGDCRGARNGHQFDPAGHGPGGERGRCV